MSRIFFVTTAAARVSWRLHLLSLYERLVIFAGEHVFWSDHYVTIAQRRRMHILCPLIARLYTDFNEDLSSELLIIGRQKFLRH